MVVVEDVGRSWKACITGFHYEGLVFDWGFLKVGRAFYEWRESKRFRSKIDLAFLKRYYVESSWIKV